LTGPYQITPVVDSCQEKKSMRNMLWLATLLFGSFTFAQSQVSPSFWGIHFNDDTTEYPAPQNPHPTFNVMRLWDTATTWSDLNVHKSDCTVEPDYGTFAALDARMATVPAGWDIIYTVASTPCYYSSNKTGTCPSDFGPGGCLPSDWYDVCGPAPR
jgi:hypothetical protein